MQRFALSRRPSGFSLIEVLLVLCVIAVIVGISIPVYYSWLNGRRDQDAAARAQVLDVQKSRYLSEQGGTAVAAWTTAADDNARYQLIKGELAAPPALLGDGTAEGTYTPRGYLITLNGLTQPCVATRLKDGGIIYPGGTTGTSYLVAVNSSDNTMGATLGGGTYESGSTVTVTAQPFTGSMFVRWTEASVPVSTDAAYSFAVGSARTLVAEFAPSPAGTYTLTVLRNNTLAGTVSAVAGSYASGTAVSPTATPNAGWVFDSWTGDIGAATASATTIALTMDRDRTVQANFVRTSVTVSLVSNNAAFGSVSGGGVFPAGTNTTLTATPFPGYQFVRWLNGATLVSNAAAFSYTASADITLTAEFALEPNTGVIAGTYGGAGKLVQFSVDAQGRLLDAQDSVFAVNLADVNGAGTMAAQNADNVNITGGSIAGVSFTALNLVNPTITGGSINNTPIGATNPNTGRFTSLEATGAALARVSATTTAGGVNLINEANDAPAYSGTAGGFVGTTSAHPLQFITNGQVRMGIAADGTVTVGGATLNPNAYVQKAGDTMTGDLTFSGNGRRILGDFGNGTHANRLLFQSSTTDGGTSVGAMPNGSGASSAFTTYSTSDANNAVKGQMYTTSGGVVLNSGKVGGATTQSLSLSIDDTPALTISPTTRNVSIGGTPVGYARLDITGPTNVIAGPHIATRTDADAYPLSQLLSWSHNNVGLSFDAYYDSQWYSSHAGSNYQLYKTNDMLRARYNSGTAPGGIITWKVGTALDGNGNFGIGADPDTAFGASRTTVDVVGPAGQNGGLVQVRTADNSVQGYYFVSTGGGTVIGSRTNSPLYFRTNATDRGRIDAAGRVAFSTSTLPSALAEQVLHVHKGSAGGYPTWNATDVALFEHSANAAVSLLSPLNSAQALYFSSPNSRVSSGISSFTNRTKMQFTVRSPAGLEGVQGMALVATGEYSPDVLLSEDPAVSPLARIHILSKNITAASEYDKPYLLIESQSSGGTVSDGSQYRLHVAQGTGLVDMLAGAKKIASAYQYTGTRGASRIHMGDGAMNFYTSPATSGTAGAAIAWNPAVSIDNAGKLFVAGNEVAHAGNLATLGGNFVTLNTAQTITAAKTINYVDAQLRLGNSNNGANIGTFWGDTNGTAQLGWYNGSGGAVGVVAAGTQRSFFGFNSSGAVGSLTNNFGSPAFRNYLDDGSGNVQISGRYNVQNGQDGGTGRGIAMWGTSDNSWAIYMGQSGAGKSFAGGAATAGYDFSQHAIRSRVSNNGVNGFIWENSSEALLASLNASTGNFYTKGHVIAGGDINATGRAYVLGAYNATDGGVNIRSIAPSIVFDDTDLSTSWMMHNNGDGIVWYRATGYRNGTWQQKWLLDSAGAVAQEGSFTHKGNYFHSTLHGNYNKTYLAAADNGAGNGEAGLYTWISEPGMTWTGAGIARNMNMGSSALVNPSLTGQMIRFNEGSGIEFATRSGATHTVPFTIQLGYSQFAGAIFSSNGHLYFQTNSNGIQNNDGTAGVVLGTNGAGGGWDRLVRAQTGGYTFDFNPNGQVYSTFALNAPSYNSTSTRRYKENIVNLSPAQLLEHADQLTPVRYDWKKGHGKGGTDIGFIAEDVEKLFPEVVAHDTEGNVSGLDYGRLTTVAIGAIKELNTKNALLETKLAALETRFAKLDQRRDFPWAAATGALVALAIIHLRRRRNF